MTDATLTLAEWPTWNLDPQLGPEVMRLLRRVAKEQGRSIVIVSHDQRIEDIADRVLWLEDGQFKERTAMAVDPVCQMRIEQGTAVVAAWDSERVSFCSRGCRDEFLGAP